MCRLQYWGLIEEMRSKHRRFFLRQGTSGWKEEGEGAQTDGPVRPVCTKAGCTDRAMPARYASHLSRKATDALFASCKLQHRA